MSELCSKCDIQYECREPQKNKTEFCNMYGPKMVCDGNKCRGLG